MKKEKLKNLTAECLQQMTEEVGDVAKLVMNHLSDADIDKLPKDVKEILHIKRDNSSDDNSMWISLFGGMC